MAKKMSTTRTQNCDDNASSRKSGAAFWSDLNHDVLYLVMMQLGVVDFVSFSGVCKSWRSLALCKRKMFMASKPPMSMWISSDANDKECELKDVDGRKFKTIIAHSAGKRCVGLTCGYLVFFSRNTKDFWLVNLITRHELHFPDFPSVAGGDLIRAIIVFSPSIHGWVFVVINRFNDNIWFLVEGKGAWNHLSSTKCFLDLHAFKGKIYTLNNGYHIYELRINPEPQLTLVETSNFIEPRLWLPEFVNSSEKLQVVVGIPENGSFRVKELDFGKMKWVLLDEKTIEEHSFFISVKKHGGIAIKPESWAIDPRPQYKRYDCFPYINQNDNFFSTNMWYFPRFCLDVDHINEC